MFHRLIESREGILVMAVAGLISVLKLGDRTIKASARQIITQKGQFHIRRVCLELVGRIPRVDNAS